MKKNTAQLLAFISIFSIFIISIIFISAPIYSTVTILDKNVKNFPEIETHFFVLDNWQRVVTSPETVGEIQFYDNDKNLEIKEIQNSVAANSRSSIVISFDLGIGNRTNLPNDFALAKSYATQFLSYIDENLAEIALLSFSQIPSTELDFTSEMSEIATQIDKLESSSTSNIFRSFVSEPTGSLSFLRTTESYSKSVLLVTQGILSADETELIIAQANENNIQINVLYICDVVPENIERIAAETGGYCVNSADLEKQRLPFLASLAKLSEGFLPYKIKADVDNSKSNCDGKHLFSVRTNEFGRGEFESQIDEIRLSQIETFPDFLEFPSVLPSTSLEKTISLQAKNYPIYIEEIRIDNPLFVIKSGIENLPLTVGIDEKLDITISYNPVDSSISFARLIINSDACLYDTVFLTGGFPNVPPKTKTIMFDSPKCNDVLVIGDTVDVSWLGVLPKDVVQIITESHSNGKLDTVGRNLIGLDYRFAVPDIGFDSLRFFVNQFWPNNVGKTMDLRHDTSVSLAFFNKYEDKVITTTTNQYVRIWNSNSGELLHTFPQFAKNVQWAIFFGEQNSIEDKYIAIACQDSTAYLYDARDYSLIWRYKVQDKLVNSIELSKDGKYAVISVGNGSFDVIDVATGNKITSKKFSLSCRYAQFNPVKEYEIMAITSHDGIIRFFDLAGNITDSIDVREGAEFSYSYYATYNWNGTKILFINTTHGTAQLIDRNLRSVLYSLEHTPGKHIVNFATFFHSETDDYILTSGNDNSLRRWNTVDGSPSANPAEFWEHKQTVNTGVFNADGWRVLSASNDKIAKIWNLNQKTLQSDTSCFLRVDYAKAQTRDTIDLGNAYIGETNIKTISHCIENICDFSYKIYSIRIVGENPADFSMIDEIDFPMKFNSKANISLNLIFNPKDVGNRTALLEIIIPNDTLHIVLAGIGMNIGLQPTVDLINFGNVYIDDYKDVKIPVAINVSEKNIDIKKFYISGPQAANFKHFWENETENFVLKPNDTLFLPMQFFPLEEGQKNAVLFLEHSFHNFPMRWNLTGNGVLLVEDTVEIKIENFTAEIGEFADFPFYIATKTNNSELKIDKIILSLIFNSSLLFPSTFSDEITILNSEFLENNLKKITVAMPYKLGNQRIDGLRFLSTWGNDTVTKISVSNPEIVGNSRVFIATNDAIFTVKNYCEADGLELFFENDGKLELEQNIPNPAKNETKINFEITENGNSSLKIYNENGNLVKTIFNSNKKGKFSVTVPINELPKGIYYYVLETFTNKIVRKMLVN